MVHNHGLGVLIDSISLSQTELVTGHVKLQEQMQVIQDMLDVLLKK